MIGSERKRKRAAELVELGDHEFRTGRTEAAEDALTRAHTLFREAGDEVHAGIVLVRLARIHSSQGRTQRAIDCLTDAAKIFRGRGEAFHEATALRRLGSLGIDHAHLDPEFLDLAAGELTRAFELWEGIDLGSGADLSEYGRLLEEWARLNNSAGLSGEAEHWLQSAKSVWRLIGDREGEARVAGSLGDLCFEAGRFDQALGWYEAAGGAFRALAESAPTDNEGFIRECRIAEANAQLRLGMIRKRTGDFAEAFENAGQAREIFVSLGHLRGEATALDQMAVAAGEMRRDEEAMSYLRRALELCDQVNDLAGKASVLHNFGWLQSRNWRNQQAVDAYLTALEIARDLQDERLQAHVLWSLAAHYAIRAVNLARAEEYTEAAVDAFERAGDRDSRARALGELAAIYHRRGRREESHRLFREAIAAASTLRERTVGQQLRAGYFSNFIEMHLFYARALLEDGDVASALYVLEHAKARSFLDLIAEAGIDIYQDEDPEILRELASPSGVLVPSAHEVYEGEIRRSNPRLAQLVPGSPWEPWKVQSEVLDGRTVLLEYVLGDSLSALFVVTRQGVEAIELPEREVVERAVRDLLVDVREDSGAGCYRKGYDLYKLLVAPAEPLIEGKDLLIVPDGLLHHLPFSLLLTEKPTGGRSDVARLPYLVHRHAVTYAPSATVAGTLATTRRERASQQYNVQMTCFARPLQEPAGRGPFESADPALEEAREIAKLFAGDEVRMRTAADATKSAVLDALNSGPTTRFVHIATHGVVDSERPHYSGLAFAAGDVDGDDGFLRTFEIFGARLTAELVVLSACDTGLGKLVHGEGIVGLARAFFHAGALSLVVSLWPVVDYGTAELMPRFYSHIIDGRSHARALQAAQVEMIEGGTWSHPYFWAPFVLIGTTGPVTEPAT